jgi:hypothetical protein
MQKSGFQPASTLPPRMNNRRPRNVHLRRSCTSRIWRKEWARHRLDVCTTAPKSSFLAFSVPGREKVHIFDPFFESRRPITITWRNCNNPIRTHYVSCDHPSIMQAKVWCFELRVSELPMKWMFKIRVFWLYSYLTNELNIYLIGRLIINYTYMKHKGFWGFGVFHLCMILWCICRFLKAR